MPGFALTSALNLALLLALAPSFAWAVQTDTTDHAVHHRFVLPNFTFEDGTTLPNTVLSYGTYGRLTTGRTTSFCCRPATWRATMTTTG